MSIAVPPNDCPDEAVGLRPPDPARLLQILETILSTPTITNDDAATADAWINFDGLSIEECTASSVLAAARFAYQAGGLQLIARPWHLRVVR